ncbi:putative -like protein [Neofusicoccum parvum UCRNP2]|uniref:Putative-like protein n=1 Tax=Botryosphaeria parva (strain UCR-NP2) TaxID=1287680 RepID=R1GTP4_BOTPV|nr:putative -like protein [Neofusicoccum parvum UCRNP2]
MLLSSAAADPSNHLLADWTSVLGALHGAAELRVDSDTLVGIIASASSILDIVDYLRLRHPVLAPLELALLGSEQALWQSVCAAPVQWVNLAVRLRSFYIFREACCHVVGGWAGWSQEQRGELRGDVRELCARKAEKFEAFKEGLEQRLLEYRHEKLRYDPAVDKGRGKKTHEPDVLIWQAQYLLMNWLARMFWEGRGRSAMDGGYGLYKMLWEGNCCEPVKQAKLSPLTPAGRSVVAEHVREMQGDLKKMVKPVMISNLKLDQSLMPANRLTPFTIKPRDCPWNTEDTTDQDSSQRSRHSRRQEAAQHNPDEEDDLEDFIS